MKKKGFGSKLLRKYRLTIHNENKLENVLGFYISPLWVILSLFFSFLLVAGVLYLIVVFTPVGNLLPGYMSEDTKEKLISNNIRIDSLTREVEKQDRYIANISAILRGDTIGSAAMPLPETFHADSINIGRSELEETFINGWEEREKHNLISQATTVASLYELNLFRPTQGEMITAFDAEGGHFGVDIAELPGESVLAIHDGTVVMSDYTANDGYTIVIQHRENLISVYRNCHRLLKSVGEKVIGGEAIGILNDGNDDNASKKAYLHFELWHRGKPLDPNIYIAF